MQKQINANKRNTILTIFGFSFFVCVIGGLLSYFYNDVKFIFLFAIITLIYVVVQYYFADKEALRFSGAKEIQKSDNQKLFSIVEEIATAANVPMPRVYIINESAPNAFATGRDPEHSSIAVTTGLLEVLDKNELASVIAHEMSHIKNYDIRVSTIVFGLVCLVGLFSDLGFRLLFYGRSRRSSDEERSPIGFLIIVISAILSPIAASLVQMAVSREREYLADASSAKITNDPDSMISALKKLDIHARPMRSQNPASESIYITNPLKKGLFSNLFSTHPPIEKRIARLENAKKK